LHEITQKRNIPFSPGSARIRRNKDGLLVYILLLPAILITFIFAYVPLPGIIVAFQNYNIFKGIFGSPWVGLKHIIDIVRLPALSSGVLNTMLLSALTLLCSFPAAITLALLFNELRVGVFKKVVQTISYLPYFLSWISVIGIGITFLSSYGTINDIRVALFGQDTERIMFLSKQEYFVPILLLLTLWKEIGWNSIIYLAAISSIDVQLYEAARADGANRLQQTWHITLPCIKPTIIILLIFSMGSLFSSNFELVYGMQNPFIKFDVISTIVYSRGIVQANYSMATAVGFVQGLISFLLVFFSNKVAKKVSEVYIW
jgi:putative aldouronate transport system permease protein